MNAWPKTRFEDPYVLRNAASGEPLANMLVEITRGDGSKLKVITDAAGKTPLQKSEFIESPVIRILGPA
jgi:type VI secretion system secreted protein VgrG